MKGPIISTAIISLTMLVLPGLATAQPGFGRVASEPWNGGLTVRNEMRSKSAAEVLGQRNVPGGGLGGIAGGRNSAPSVPRTVSVNLVPLLNAQWSDLRAAMVDSALKYFHERNVGGGFRTSRNRITIGDPGPMFAGWDGRGFTLRFIVPGNQISTYFRTPTPLDRDFDPGFEVNFDFEVTMDINVANNQLVAGPARITPTVKKPEGKNLTGDFVLAVNNLVSVISGADFIGGLLKHVNATSIGLPTGLNNQFAQVNPILRAAANGGVVSPAMSQGGLLLTIRDRSAPPVVR